MHYIILAAGRGSRANSAEKNLPKVLLKDTCGRSFLENILDGKREYSGDHKVIVVAGFLHGMVIKEVEEYKDKYNVKEITTVVNYQFDRGVISSFYEGIIHTDGDVVIMNGDTCYPKEMFKEINGLTQSTLMVIPASSDQADSVRVLVEGSEIRQVGKGIDNFNYISIGCLFLTRKHKEILKQAVEELMQKENSDKLTWHSLINILVERGEIVQICESPSEEYYEVDTEEDYEKFLLEKAKYAPNNRLYNNSKSA